MTTSTKSGTLKTVISANPYAEPLKDGTVQVPGVELEHVQIPILQAFRRMCRSLDFEICEVAVVTYFTARRYGLPMTGIPVFPLARFEHNGIVYNDQLIKSPKEMEGKKVGVRAYTVTPGVWARAVLKEEHGVDLKKVTWVLGDEEHVGQFHKDAPANLEYQVGVDLQKMLADGEIVAGLQVAPGEYSQIKPLYPDPRAAGIAAFQRTGGVYPLTHMMVVRDDVLKDNPGLLRALVDAFKASKEAHRQKTGAPEPKELYEDPLPIGMSATRKSLEVLMHHSVDQGVLDRPLDLDEIFPGNLD
jgi:4,5-dihydroxyphthalate decarboxylase